MVSVFQKVRDKAGNLAHSYTKGSLNKSTLESNYCARKCEGSYSTLVFQGDYIVYHTNRSPVNDIIN